MKNIFKDRLITVYKFLNPSNTKYIGMQFNVPINSEESYRGLPLTKKNQARLVKLFRTIANKIEKLDIK